MIQWRDHIAGQLASFFENRISKLLIDVIIADQRHQRVKTNDPVKDELIIFKGRFIHGLGSENLVQSKWWEAWQDGIKVWHR